MFIKRLIVSRLLSLLVLVILPLTFWGSVSADEDCDPISDISCSFEQDEPTSTKSESGYKPAETVPSYTNEPYAGPKQTIAVLSFENKTRGVRQSSQLGEGMAEMLVSELIKTNRYLLVERSAIKEIIQEQSLGQSGLVQSRSAVNPGGLAGAQFLIKGAVTEFKYVSESGGTGLVIKQFSFGTESKSAHVGIDIRVIDSSTGHIVASHHASAKADASGFKIGVTESDFQIKGGKFEQTPLGVATRQAIRDAVGFIINESKKFVWYGSIIKVTGNSAYINRGANSGLKHGQSLLVYSKGEALIDPETGINLGSDEKHIGDLTITSMKEKFSIGTFQLFGTENVKRGDIVRLNE